MRSFEFERMRRNYLTRLKAFERVAGDARALGWSPDGRWLLASLAPAGAARQGDGPEAAVYLLSFRCACSAARWPRRIFTMP